MFQYATARTLAERVGCGLVLAGNTLGRRFGLVGHWLALDEAPGLKGMQQNGVLRAAFERGPDFYLGRAVELAFPCFKWLLFPRAFSPRMTSVCDSMAFEEFDETIFNQVSGTWLSGWFQSEKYFAPNADRVRGWFQPTRRCSRRANELMRQWPSSPENMVGIHVRRGDYARIRDGLGQADQGWLLAMSYYHNALDHIPRDAPLALFSDEPDWAANEFSYRHPWISRGNSAAVDMYLMSQCRWNITANSSFSWWAAWLNAHANKVVFAPKYHLGWRIGNWVPGGIDVAGWKYLDVSE